MANVTRQNAYELWVVEAPTSVITFMPRSNKSDSNALVPYCITYTTGSSIPEYPKLLSLSSSCKVGAGVSSLIAMLRSACAIRG